MQLLCAHSLPQDSCKVFCIFVFIDKYSLLRGKQTGQSLTLGARTASPGVSQGLFQQQSYPRPFPTPRSGLADQLDSGPTDISDVYFKLSKRRFVSFQ